MSDSPPQGSKGVRPGPNSRTAEPPDTHVLTYILVGLALCAAIGGIVYAATRSGSTPTAAGKIPSKVTPPATTGPSVPCPLIHASDLANYIHPSSKFDVPGCSDASTCSISSWFNNQCVMACPHTIAILETAGAHFVKMPDGRTLGVVNPSDPTEEQRNSACGLANVFDSYAQNAEENPGSTDSAGVTNFYFGVAACINETYKCK